MSPPVRPEQDPYAELGQQAAGAGGDTDPYAGLGVARSPSPSPAPTSPPRLTLTGSAPGVRADITAAIPTTPARYAQAANLPERAIQQVGEFATGAVRHPITTAEGLVTAPLGSAYRAFEAPVQGSQITENEYLGGKAGIIPGVTPRLVPGTVITAQNTPSSITPQQFHQGLAQTMANAASVPLGEGVSVFARRALAPVTDAGSAALFGRAAGGAVGAFPVGAAYTPNDPLAGGLAMATIGGGLPFAGEAARRAASRVTMGARTTALAGSQFDLAPAAPPITERPDDLAAAQGSAPPTTGPAAAPAAPGLRRRIAETIDPTIATTMRTDEFTGLGSQGAFKRALPSAEADPTMGVATGDLSGLKALNDTHGHAAGDQAILRAANALAQAAGEAGPAYRVFRSGKGDEFTVLGPREGLPTVAQRAETLYGVQDHGADVRTAFPMGVGSTFAEADQAAYARKAAANAAYGIASRSAAPATASSSVTTLPTNEIRVDPARFQFKQGTSAETGAGRELGGVQSFNPDLAGVISVWRDPEDGGTYVVNGHHRVELAKRLGVPALDVRYLSAPTAEEARATGALINIAEGRGTPLDAAKFFRDTQTGPEDLDARGVSLRGAVASRGLSLSKLSPDLFDRVARGDIPEETGAAIGKVLDQPEQQRAAVHLIEQSGRRLTPNEAENVARQVRDAGSTSTTQETLFGTEETALSLAVDRARLSEALSHDIARDARLFGYVSREGRAGELARAGNLINVERSAQLAGESAGHAELFDRLATRSGPIGDILTAGARRLAQGEKLATVKADIAPHLRDAIRATLGGREGPDVLGTAPGIGERESAPGEPEGGAGVSAAPAAGGEAHATDSIDPAQSGLFAAETADDYAHLGQDNEPNPYEQLGHEADADAYTDLGQPDHPRIHEARDLFGNEEPEPAESAQPSLFGAKEGTAESRSLAQTEAAYRAELPKLRAMFERSIDPAARAQLGARIADMERLINRASGISADELRARIVAGQLPALTADGEAAGPGEPNRWAQAVDRGPEPERTAAAPVTADEAAVRVNRFGDALRRMFAPETRTKASAITARVIREHAAEMARQLEMAREATRDLAKTFDAMPEAARLDFMDRIETGQPQPSAPLQQAAALFRQLLDGKRDEIRALGTGKLDHYIADYFPHLWEDPNKAQGVIARLMSKRSLTGPGTFLKHRDIPTIREGIEAGLRPVSTNPVDLVLLKLREMSRYLLGQRVMAEMREQGLARFVAAMEQPPAGFQRINDKVATVYGPPTVPVREAFDKIVREGLANALDAFGVEHVRKPRIGGTRLGYAEVTGEKIVTRFGGENSVIMHELGHALDAHLGLWRQLTDIPGTSKGAIAERKLIHGELRALADLRYEGEEAPVAFQRYVRNRYEKTANAVAALLYAPDRMAAVAPNIKARLTEILRSDPRSAPLLDVKPSLVLSSATSEVPVGGLVVKGQFWAPEPTATVLNNYLSPGFRGNPIYDAYRGVGNLLNQAQLGLSAFHLGFTSIDATVSKASLGIEQLFSGKPLSALGSFARTPIAPLETYLRGSKVLGEYLRPGTQGGEMAQFVDGLVAGGGRVRMDQFYSTGAAGEFWKALRGGRYGTAALKTIPTALEYAAKPIFEHVVPRMKLGVFADLARYELAKLPDNASRDAVREAMAKAWDSVDNRMGELVYDNLLWSRALKDLGLASVRSLGWNLGSARELGGGLTDLAKQPLALMRGGKLVLTHRGAYVIALPTTVGLMGGMLGYLMTGQAPQTLKDWFYPRTGRRDADGNDERVALPSYMKDVGGFARHPVQTVQSKVHPLLAAVWSMLNNQDFYGNEIRNPDDPLVLQAKQETEYLAQQFEPFGIRNASEERQFGQSRGLQAGAFFGLTPAPRAVVRSTAQNQMEDYLRQRAPKGLTPEESAARRTESTLRAAFLTHQPDAMAKLRGAVASGTLRASQANAFLKALEAPPTVPAFKALRLNEAVQVYQLATPAERTRWAPVLQAKLDRANPDAYTPAEQAAIRRGLAAIRAHP